MPKSPELNYQNSEKEFPEDAQNPLSFNAPHNERYEVPPEPEKNPYQEEFESINRQFERDLERGAIGWIVNTKIPTGAMFKGKESNGSGYNTYLECKNGKIRDIVKFYFPSARESIWKDKEKADFMLGLRPVKKRVIETEKRMERQETGRWFWKREKYVPVESKQSKYYPAILKDYGITGEDENDEFYSMSIEYGFFNPDDQREGSTMMSIIMPKSLAVKVFEEIKRRPQSIKNIIKITEPELLEFNPLLDKKNSPKIVSQDATERVRGSADYEIIR